ncbi:MAG: prolyl aminopeptidase [Alphaproteobacteria bacterium]|nr:MAG: prolyl aminopeptidase [Alphaproteobacteria bacterium]
MSRGENEKGRRRLYPPIAPAGSGFLDVGEGHRIYHEWSGRADGLPILFLHGGPGGGTSPMQRRFFDPARWRIVLFDQRGCGRSLPHASIEANTTDHLLADIERLREHLGIDRWAVFGGSWGSTLALLYAEACPERVTGLILRGIFLARPEEIRWFYQEGAGRIFPEAFARFVSGVPEDERHNLLAAYYRRLTHPDPTVRLNAAHRWARWEASTVTLAPDPAHLREAQSDHFALALARIECHYFLHRAFLRQPDQILAQADRLHDIPTTIVQGRYDVICPPKSAFDLKDALPHAELRIVPLAGHSAFEPAIVHELVLATDRLADRLDETKR